MFLPKKFAQRAFDATTAPVLEVDPGALVTFEVGDTAYQRLHEGESIEDFTPGDFNLVTGPVLVRGAAPGDALVIELLDVEIERIWAVWIPEFGPLGERITTLQVSPLFREGDRIRISERVVVPLAPMVGCIGLAPAEGRGSTIEPAYPFGGNLDLREFSPGASIWLPVQVPGALLSLGDLHAAMGTGEPTWLSLEASGRATVRIGLEKGRRLVSPRLRAENATICVAVLDEDGSWDEAYQIAMDQAYDFLIGELGMAPFEAYAYACARVSVRFGGPASAIVLAVVPDPWDAR